MNVQRGLFGALLILGFVELSSVDTVHAQRKTAASAARITVLGCVRRTEPIEADKIGTTAIPADDTKYVLSNITLVPATGISGDQSATQPIAEAVKMYRLDDSGSSLIAPHVGDRVEVTGTIVPTRPSATGTSGRTDPTFRSDPRADAARRIAAENRLEFFNVFPIVVQAEVRALRKDR